MCVCERERERLLDGLLPDLICEGGITPPQVALTGEQVASVEGSLTGLTGCEPSQGSALRLTGREPKARNLFSSRGAVGSCPPR